MSHPSHQSHPSHPSHPPPPDILVVGAGPAGIAAAISAARSGEYVTLIEREAFLGGTARACWVGTVCGLYLRDTRAAAPSLASGGFPREFAERLAAATQSAPIALPDGLFVLPCTPGDFERVAQNLIDETGSIKVLLRTTLHSLQTENGRVTQVHAHAPNGPLTFHPHCLVDATGEAAAAALAGAATMDGLCEQAPAAIFAFENAGPDFDPPRMLGLLRDLRRAVGQGLLPAGCERLSLVPAPPRASRLAFKLALPPFVPDEPAHLQVTRFERDAHAMIDAIQRYLIANCAALRHARFAGGAPRVGVRAGRRIAGQATLNETDVLTCRKFDDGIARGCWPIERWNGAARPMMTFHPEKDYYEIPLGCLCPRGVKGLFVAGRAISAEPAAIASARVIATALSTGWAAGKLAAAQAAGRAVEGAVEEIRMQMAE